MFHWCILKFQMCNYSFEGRWPLAVKIVQFGWNCTSNAIQILLWMSWMDTLKLKSYCYILKFQLQGCCFVGMCPSSFNIYTSKLLLWCWITSVNSRGHTWLNFISDRYILKFQWMVSDFSETICILWSIQGITVRYNMTVPFYCNLVRLKMCTNLYICIFKGLQCALTVITIMALWQLLHLGHRKYVL